MELTIAAKERQDGRDFSDWSRKGPLPELPQNQRRVSDRPPFPGRGTSTFDNMSDAGSERGGRRQYEQGDGKIRDFSNWERKGPLSPAVSAAPSLREGGRQQSKDSTQFRRASPAWGEGTGRSQDGSRPPRREYQEKPPVERQPTASELDSQWRARMKPDAPARSPTPSRDSSNPPSPAPVTMPTGRPRLNLQKRTVSEAVHDQTSAASATDSKASPFGAARPVDTTARDREIEEKRQLEIRQRAEQLEKEKAAKAEEKKTAKEAEERNGAEGKEDDATGQEEDVHAAAPSVGKNYEILRRSSEAKNGMTANEDDEAAEPEVVLAGAEDKDVKPKEIVRDARPPKPNGDRRRNSQQNKPAPAQETAMTMDEDGWSTVSKNKKQNNNRRSNQAARAIAS